MFRVWLAPTMSIFEQFYCTVLEKIKGKIQQITLYKSWLPFNSIQDFIADSGPYNTW